jgi:hypothetical protein
MMRLRTALVAGFVIASFALAPAGFAEAPDVPALVAKIKTVGKEGRGNDEAAQAWKALVQAGPAAVPQLLTTLNQAEPVAANWLRSAVDAIGERALLQQKPLAAEPLETFVRETANSGTARRLAYEWLIRSDPSAADRLLPGMLNDPGVELRREAVERVYQQARQALEKGNRGAATAWLRDLFPVARERDQVDQIAKELKGLGVTVDVMAHYGFITKWKLIGPFDNAGKKGFEAVFAPEKKVDATGRFEGKNGQQLTWIDHQTADPLGMVDLNKAIGKHMGAVAYAFAALVSAAERTVEIRAGSNNAIKMFLNGKPIYFRDEYHHGSRMDQHIGTGTLRAGRNEILVKVCQNEQTEDWAQTWSFQLRVCDSLGGAVPVTVQAAEGKEGAVERKGQP